MKINTLIILMCFIDISMARTVIIRSIQLTEQSNLTNVTTSAPTTIPSNQTVKPVDPCENCNPANGRCITFKNITSCVCNNGKTFDRNGPPNNCDYSQKELLTAFLLSFFIGWTCWIGLGVCKLILHTFFLCIFSCCIFPLAIKGKSTILAVFGGIIVACACIGLPAWLLYDLISIGIGDLSDYNGYPISGNIF